MQNKCFVMNNNTTIINIHVDKLVANGEYVSPYLKHYCRSLFTLGGQ